MGSRVLPGDRVALTVAIALAVSAAAVRAQAQPLQEQGLCSNLPAERCAEASDEPGRPETSYLSLLKKVALAKKNGQYAELLDPAKRRIKQCLRHGVMLSFAHALLESGEENLLCARDYLRRFIEMPLPDRRDSDDWKAARDEANTLLDEVQKRIGKISVEVDLDDGCSVTVAVRKKEEKPDQPWTVARGEHEFVAGAYEWTASSKDCPVYPRSGEVEASPGADGRIAVAATSELVLPEPGDDLGFESAFASYFGQDLTAAQGGFRQIWIRHGSVRALYNLAVVAQKLKDYAAAWDAFSAVAARLDAPTLIADLAESGARQLDQQVARVIVTIRERKYQKDEQHAELDVTVDGKKVRRALSSENAWVPGEPGPESQPPKPPKFTLIVTVGTREVAIKRLDRGSRWRKDRKVELMPKEEKDITFSLDGEEHEQEHDGDADQMESTGLAEQGERPVGLSVLLRGDVPLVPPVAAALVPGVAYSLGSGFEAAASGVFPKHFAGPSLGLTLYFRPGRVVWFGPEVAGIALAPTTDDSRGRGDGVLLGGHAAVKVSVWPWPHSGSRRPTTMLLAVGGQYYPEARDWSYEHDVFWLVSAGVQGVLWGRERAGTRSGDATTIGLR